MFGPTSATFAATCFAAITVSGIRFSSMMDDSLWMYLYLDPLLVNYWARSQKQTIEYQLIPSTKHKQVQEGDEHSTLRRLKK